LGKKGDVYDFMLFSESFYFLQENFNVWIGEKHKIIDVPISLPGLVCAALSGLRKCPLF
jgi:hypothetical protein